MLKGGELGRRAVAALEFALVAPLLVLLLFGVYDISSAMITYGEVFNAARVIPVSASNIAVQNNGATELTYAQIQTEASSIWAQIPALRTGFQDGTKSVTVSSINFEKTNPACVQAANACAYTAYVVWSVAYTGGTSGRTFQQNAAVLRACGAKTSAPDVALTQIQPSGGAASDLTKLRTANVTTPDPVAAPPDPILVVDVHMQYRPVFSTFVKLPVDFWANGYWPVRNVQASSVSNNVVTSLAPDQQYTGIVSTGTLNNGVITGPYSAVGGPAPNTSYCISSYYPEPSS